MGRERVQGLTSGSRFAIAAVVAIILHGMVLMMLTGMRVNEPRQSRIMVGVMLKAPEHKPEQPAVEAPPPPAPEAPPAEPPVQQPVEQPVIPKPVATKAPPVPSKPIKPEKSLPRPQPSKPVRPQEPAKSSDVTGSATSTQSESSNLADASAVTEISPPQFHADYLHNPQPRYPLMSRKRREQGEVLLRVRVDAQGHPESVTIHQSSGYSRLDHAACNAVEQWRFMPARQGGVNLAAWVIVPIQFNLEK